MKNNRVHIWEWVVWIIAILVTVFALITTFGVGNLGVGILLAIVLAAMLCGIIYRIDHPEKYDQVVGWFKGSMNAKVVQGISSARGGKQFAMNLERDRLIISDRHRETYSLNLTDVIDAEALSGEETQVWKEKQPEPKSGRYAKTSLSIGDRIRTLWGKWFDRYLIVHYRDRTTGATKALIFLYRGDLKGKQFAEELKHRAAFGATVNL